VVLQTMLSEFAFDVELQVEVLALTSACVFQSPC
jgi:hypothetical protein